MSYDVLTISPTVSDAAHAAGDVIFNLTAVELPARSCKLINCFLEVASGGGEDDTKIGLLFFEKNTTASLGTLNATANISSANFTANGYQGSVFLGLTDSDSKDLDVIDNVGLYYGMSQSQYASSTRGGSGMESIVIKAEAAKPNTAYVAAVVHSGAPDFDGTANVKVHLHVEY